MHTPPADAPPPDNPGPATRVRYLVVGLTMLTAVLLYLDRYCLSFAERYIKEDLGLSNDQMAWVLSAFFWTYALAQVPSGSLSDRYGPRLMLTVYVLLWSLFTGLTGLAAGFVMLLLMRLGCGLAQAGAYPTSAGLVGRWVPVAARGTASALIAVGGRLGGFLAPILTALLIVAFVPPSVPSRLNADDVLDYPRLCHELVKEPTTLGRRVLAGLSPPAREDVRRQAALYEAAHDPQARAALPEPSADRAEAAVAALNHLLRDPRLPEEASAAAAKLPGEARALLQRSAELSEGERERLNRLVLETVFPQVIRSVYVPGWRPALLVFGLAGLGVAGLFWLGTRDDPARHPRCNAAEVDLIRSGQPPATARRGHGVPLGPMARSPSMWLMCLSQLTTNLGWAFLVTWLPRYLDEAHRVPIEERSALAGVPLLVGWAGMLAGGWATDRLSGSVGVRWGRALPIALSRFAAVAAYALCLLDPGPVTATAAFAIVAFATDFGSPAVWAFSLDVTRRHVGAVLGWGNMWGNIGAAVSPVLLNAVLGGDRWDLVFLTCAAAFLLSGLCALGINAAEPLDREDQGADLQRG